MTHRAQLIVAVAATGVAALGIVAVAAVMWAGSDVPISFHGVLALAATVLGALGLAVGLMGLVFYSARSGHDERAHETYSQPVADDPNEPDDFPGPGDGDSR